MRTENPVTDTEYDDNEDEVEFVDHDPSDEEVEAQAAAEVPRALVVVDNLDDAERTRFWVPFNVKVRRAIKRTYKRLGTEQAPGDRLTRADNGDSAFDYADIAIRRYILKYGGKARIHWEFAGDTGGA